MNNELWAFLATKVVAIPKKREEELTFLKMNPYFCGSFLRNIQHI